MDMRRISLRAHYKSIVKQKNAPQVHLRSFSRGLNMIKHISESLLLEILEKSPEQITFDWKTNFKPPTDEESRAEIIKDITAIANGCSEVAGFIFYGVNPKNPKNPIVGISAGYDDASLQQLIKKERRTVGDILLLRSFR